MTALTGFKLLVEPVWTRDHLNMVPLDVLGEWLYDERQCSVSPTGASSVVTKNPQTSYSRVLSGNVTRAFHNDYYGRVHITPKQIDLGNTFNDQSRKVEVWNAHLIEKELSSVSESDTGGLTLIGPIADPTTFGPLERRIYTLEVSNVGPAVVNATFQLNFPTEPVPLVVIGRRINPWPYPPNWSSPVTEELEWKVDVLKSFDGTEQRRELRTKARRSFNYYMSISGKEVSRFDNMLWAWQKRVFALPVWMDKTPLTADIVAGTSTIPVTTGDLSFTDGSLAIIYQDVRTHEIVEVKTVSTGNLELIRPVVGSWPKGTAVYPCVIGHLPNAVQVKRHTDNTISAIIDFACEPTSTNPYTPYAAPNVTYEGIEVILRQPNWRTAIENVSEFQFKTLDHEVGTVEWYYGPEPSAVKRNYQWLLRDKGEIRKFREMLGRRRGQLKAVFVPSFHDDLRLAVAIQPDDNGLTVTDSDILATVGHDLERDRLIIRLRDGSTLFRRITAVANSIHGVTLTVDVKFDNLINIADVKAIHILFKSRFSTDKISLIWRTNSVVEVNTPFVSIKG